MLPSCKQTLMTLLQTNIDVVFTQHVCTIYPYGFTMGFLDYPRAYRGFLKQGYPAGWFVIQKPKQKWIIQGYIPLFQETCISTCIFGLFRSLPRASCVMARFILTYPECALRALRGWGVLLWESKIEAVEKSSAIELLPGISVASKRIYYDLQYLALVGYLIYVPFGNLALTEHPCLMDESSINRPFPTASC